MKDDDPCWKCGMTPAGNANFGWMRHMAHLLARSSNISGESETRKNLARSNHTRSLRLCRHFCLTYSGFWHTASAKSLSAVLLVSIP